MTKSAIAIMQIRRAHTAIAAARAILDDMKATPTATGTAATIEELTGDLLQYVVNEYGLAYSDEGDTFQPVENDPPTI